MSTGRGPFFCCLNVMPEPKPTLDLVAVSDAEKRIAKSAAPAIAHMGFELVRLRLMFGSRTRLQIMADRPEGGIDVDGCARISTALSALFDIEEPVPGEYTLEVSSPGINRPLTRTRDFETWEGHKAKIETTEAIDGRRRFKGVLRGVESGEILVEIPEGIIGLGFGLVADARLAPDAGTYRASLKAARPPEIPETEQCGDLEGGARRRRARQAGSKAGQRAGRRIRRDRKDTG